MFWISSYREVLVVKEEAEHILAVLQEVIPIGNSLWKSATGSFWFILIRFNKKKKLYKTNIGVPLLAKSFSLATCNFPGIQYFFTTDKPHLKLTIYDGFSLLEDYEPQFEILTVGSGWNGNLKAALLSANLQGVAQTVFQDPAVRQWDGFNALLLVLNPIFWA